MGSQIFRAENDLEVYLVAASPTGGESEALQNWPTCPKPHHELVTKAGLGPMPLNPPLGLVAAACCHVNQIKANLMQIPFKTQ